MKVLAIILLLVGVAYGQSDVRQLKEFNKKAKWVAIAVTEFDETLEIDESNIVRLPHITIFRVKTKTDAGTIYATVLGGCNKNGILFTNFYLEHPNGSIVKQRDTEEDKEIRTAEVGTVGYSILRYVCSSTDSSAKLVLDK